MAKDTGKELAKPSAVDQDRIDKTIWKHLGVKNIREIAELVGIKPEEVLRRKAVILDQVDVLTIQEKRQKLLIELDGMARDARERAQSMPNEFYAGTINAATGNIKALLQELNRMEKADNSKVESLNQLRVQELLRLIDRTVSRAMKQIAAENGLDEVYLMNVFQGHLTEVAIEQDSN